eukprot:9399_1
MVAFLLVLYSILIIESNAVCIRSYPNHTIQHIVNNMNDPSIMYLGDRTSTTDCINNCMDLNYLCDKSHSNVFTFTDDSSNPFIFDNTDCSAQSTHSGSYGSMALLTSNIIAREYIIQIQLTITSGTEGGIVFKAQQSDEWNYWVFVNADSNTMPTGPYETNHDTPWWDNDDLGTINYNQKYNLSIHVINNTFQRYLNQQPIGNQYTIDESKWTQSHAGVITWRGSVIYHSFKLEFPNNNDNQDKYICKAYMYDKQQQRCYGYYGNDFTVIENSVSSNQIQYDSGIIYDTCPPTQYPTTQPTSTPTSPTTTHPTTNIPTTTNPTTNNPTTAAPITSQPTTSQPTAPTTTQPTTYMPTTFEPTTSIPTT